MHGPFENRGDPRIETKQTYALLVANDTPQLVKGGGNLPGIFGSRPSLLQSTECFALFVQRREDRYVMVGMGSVMDLKAIDKYVKKETIVLTLTRDLFCDSINSVSVTSEVLFRPSGPKFPTDLKFGGGEAKGAAFAEAPSEKGVISSMLKRGKKYTSEFHLPSTLYSMVDRTCPKRLCHLAGLANNSHEGSEILSDNLIYGSLR